MRLLTLIAVAAVAVASFGLANGAIPADPDAIYGGQIVWGEHHSPDEPMAQAMAEIMAQAGCTNDRDGIDWAAIEKMQGQYEWGRYDEKFKWIHSQGLKVLAVVGTAPEWATDSPPEAKKIMRDRNHNNLIGCLPILDEYWPDYERYLRAAVTRYRDVVDYYEIWNEPDGMAGPHVIRDHNGRVVDVQYGGDPKWYAELLKHSYPIIKELDPTALVAAGSMESKGGLETWFADAMYEHGAQPYFDAISIHSYGSPFNLDWVRTIRGVMMRNGDAHKPMWLTEYALNWQRRTEDAKAALTKSALRYLRETPWLSLGTFHLVNIMWTKGEEPDTLKPRKMVAAFREMTKEKEPGEQFADGFEQGVDNWYYHRPEAAVTTENVHAGKAAFAAEGDKQVTFFGSAYVARPRTLEFWYHLTADNTEAKVTLEAALYPGDIGYRPVWVMVDEGPAIGEWRQASVDLAKAVPQLAGKTVVDMGFRAQADQGSIALTIDDVVVK